MSWTRQTLLDELKGLIKGYVDTPEDMTEDTELVADLGIDSLGVMELVADIEDKFELSIDDAELREVATLGDVVRAIEVHLREQGRMAG